MFSDFLLHIPATPLAPYLDDFKALQKQQGNKAHGDEIVWRTVLSNLPVLVAEKTRLNSAAITLQSDAVDDTLRRQLYDGLQRLRPWRKGPFEIFGVRIDAEWRSDLKWRRLLPHLPNLAGQSILDVGCGNGYYGWRMRGMEADFVLGIDPGLRFIYQFQAIKHYILDDHFFVLPLKSEQMPARLACFDTVFSMGVIYHRHSADVHLQELFSFLKPGGLLVLESLVIPGGGLNELKPQKRYAQMRNVWSVPSTSYLCRLLQGSGFVDVHCVDETVTSTEEQRATDWMPYLSLRDFLDPEDSNKTVEGYPGPCRAIVLARKPS